MPSPLSKPQDPSPHKDYFKGLNGLRFIAALLVLIFHATAFLFPEGLDYNPFIHFLTKNGSHAVTFFFVLSGFLITFLLMREVQKTGTVSVRNFYIKRMVRIWPIYYLVIIIELILPFVFGYLGKSYTSIQSGSALFFYFFMMPNVSTIWNNGSSKLNHLWSIGVEEQFYLIWAPVAKFVKHNIVKICVLIIIVKLLLAYLFQRLTALYPDSVSIWFTSEFLASFGIEKMAVGGVGAWLIFRHRSRVISNPVFSRAGQVIVLGLLFFFLCASEDVLNSSAKDLYHALFGFPFGQMIIVPLLFLFVIINTSLNDRSLIRTENKALNFLGNISYGFYVYHIICYYLAYLVVQKSGYTQGSPAFSALFYTASILLTTAVSAVSYFTIEKFFLRYRPKSREKVVSNDVIGN